MHQLIFSLGTVFEHSPTPFFYIVAAMFLGMDLPGLNLPGPQKTYAMMGFVVWHIGTEVLLEIHAYRLSRKGNLLEKPYCELEGWCRVRACHANLRIWVHISSSHTKRRAWSCVSVTLGMVMCVCNLGAVQEWRQEDDWDLLAASLAPSSVRDADWRK